MDQMPPKVPPMILRFHLDKVLRQKSFPCQSVFTSANFPTTKFPVWDSEARRPPENARPLDATLPFHPAQLSTLRIQALVAEKYKEWNKD